MLLGRLGRDAAIQPQLICSAWVVWMTRERVRVSHSAFTLIELMITIVIVGVLASVAIPTYGRFMVEAKSSEGLQNIGLIFQGMTAYWEKPLTAQGTGASAAGHCLVDEPDLETGGVTFPPYPPVPYKRTYDFFQNPSFAAVGFTTADPIYFVYGWGAGGNVGVIQDMCGDDDRSNGQFLYMIFAGADLDGDGMVGGYSLLVTFRDGQLSRDRGFGPFFPYQLYGIPASFCPVCVDGVD